MTECPTGDDDGRCRVNCFNVKLVGRLRRSLPDADAVGRAEALFGALGNRNRLLILSCLAQVDELCVCDIANALDMNVSTLSHQLRHLRGMGLVKFRNEGRMVFYNLADPRVAGILSAEFDPTADGVGR